MNKNKYWLIIGVIFLSINCHRGTSQISHEKTNTKKISETSYVDSVSHQKTEINKIEILYVNPDILTIVNIHCDIFEQAFDEIKHVIVNDSDTVQQFENEIANLCLADTTKYYHHVDTRIKIRLLYKNEEICIGRFTLLYDDRLYELSNGMKALLNKVLDFPTKTEHEVKPKK
jgi:hypothetical protein